MARVGRFNLWKQVQKAAKPVDFTSLGALIGPAAAPIQSALEQIGHHLGRVNGPLYVQVLHVQRVVIDELAAGLHVFAHEGGEDGFGFGNVFQLDLK